MFQTTKVLSHSGLFNPWLWWRNLKSAGFWYVSPNKDIKYLSVKVLEKNQHIGKSIPADRKLFLDTPITWSLENLLFILPNDSRNYRFFSHFWVHFETFLQLFLISFSFSSFLQTHTHTHTCIYFYFVIESVSTKVYLGN